MATTQDTASAPEASRPEEDDTDSCDLDFAHGEKTRDEDLPPAVGGVA